MSSAEAEMAATAMELEDEQRLAIEPEEMEIAEPKSEDEALETCDHEHAVLSGEDDPWVGLGFDDEHG